VSVPRCPRALSRPIAWLAAVLQALAALVLSGFGLRPLLSPRLSPLRPEQAAPELSWTTAFLFRVLLLARWLRRSNFAAPGLAGAYLARADREVREKGASPARPIPLPEHPADALSPEAFFARYGRSPHPVVLRGLHRARRDWSLAALIGDFGDTPILMNDGFGYRVHPLRALRRDPEGERYVANCEQLLVRHPELLEALDLDAYREWTRRRAYCAQLFIGARRSLGLYFHCANNWNVFTMLHGRKRWTLVHPAHSYFMYPIVSKASAYVASIIHHAEGPPGADDLYRFCPRYEVVLEPGDVLVNPPWWWHQVENLDDDTVGCASRWAGLGGGRDPNPLFSFAQATSPEMLRTTAGTLASLLECGGDLGALYRRAARSGDATTPTERVSHTAEAMERGAVFDRIYPRPAAVRARYAERCEPGSSEVSSRSRPAVSGSVVHTTASASSGKSPVAPTAIPQPSDSAATPSTTGVAT